MPCDCLDKSKTTSAPCPDCFVAAARSYLGVRWVHQGRTRAGLDCVGLIVCAARDAGIIIEDERNYATQPRNDRLAVLLHEYCDRLEPEAAQAGDLLAIKYQEHPQHLMLVSRVTQWGPFVVHSFGTISGGGKVVEHLLDCRWLRANRARIHAAFRPKAFSLPSAPA